MSRLLVVLLAVPGCSVFLGPEPEPEPDPDPNPVELEINRKLDILFVVDDSGTMAEEQQALALSFASFEQQLAAIAGGLADIQVGVVSTNTGAVEGVSQCGDQGDAGGLLGDQCTADGSPVLRTGSETNAVDSLSATLACMTSLGTNGCGFESPLDSARRALESDELVRDDAALLVVIVTDEDDCSVADREVFFANPMADATSMIGPFSSFRCFDHGIVCDPDDPRSFGDKTDCLPDDAGMLTPISELVDAFASLKRPERLVLAGIFGEPARSAAGFSATVQANPDPGPQNGNPALAPSCQQTGIGEADPAIRLAAFLDAFPLSGSASICSDNQSAALAGFADLMIDPLSIACVPDGTTCSADGVPDCAGGEIGCLVQLNGAAACPGPAVAYRYADDDPVDLTVRVTCR